MDRSKVEQVLAELKDLVESGLGPDPDDAEKWIELLEEALADY